MTRVAIILVLACGIAGDAGADPLDRFQGAASLEYDAGYLHTFDRAVADKGLDGIGLAGPRLRGQLGSSLVGYRVGVDLRAGATAPGGFAYDVDLYLLGLGLRLGRWSRFGVTAGFGASGATGTLDDAIQIPVEAMLEVALGRRIRVIARGRIAWVGQADARDAGMSALPWGDELEASFAIRVGNRWTDYGFPVGNGYYLGVNYREAEDTKMIGAVIGHSLDAGTR